jgi:hypothetical protein
MAGPRQSHLAGSDGEYVPALGHERTYEVRRSSGKGSASVRSLLTGRVARIKHGRVSLFDPDLGVPHWVQVNELFPPSRAESNATSEESEGAVEAVAFESSEEDDHAGPYGGTKAPSTCLRTFLFVGVGVFVALAAFAASDKMHAPVLLQYWQDDL